MTPPADRASWRPRWPRMGLRSRVVVWYLVLFTGMFAVGIVTLERVLTARLDNDINQLLAQEVDELRLLADGTDPATGEPFGNDTQRIFEVFLGRNVPGNGEAFFTLVNGVPYASSAVLPDDLFDSPEIVEAWRGSEAGTYGDAVVSAGPVRWLAIPLQSGEGAEGTFAVAFFYGQDLQEVRDTVLVLAVVSIGVLVLASLLAWLAAGRAIAPLRRLDEAAQRAGVADLSERLPVEGNDEVARLTDTFNDLLSRLDAAFTTQRQFLDDVGHDLRTPITILRGNLELLPENQDERREVVALCLDELGRMERYVGDLTLLARAEQPNFLKRESVDVELLSHAMLARGRALAEDREWSLGPIAAVTCLLDEDRVVRAWLNLIANAVQHTGSGDAVSLGSVVSGGWLDLWVQDSGPGVPAEDRERIFDRLERLGSTRDHRPEGSGLGLAIVRAVAEAHGGTAWVTDTGGPGSRFTIRLPYRPTLRQSGLSVSDTADPPAPRPQDRVQVSEPS